MRIVRFAHEGRPVHAVDRGGEAELLDDLLSLKPTGRTVAAPSAGELLAPIVPTDILCIGLNYRRHAQETNSDVPGHPMLFTKASNALAGPNDVVKLPANSSRVDYEVELAVVIGRDAKDVSEQDALNYVFGYTVANDLSARDWQKDKGLNGGQFARGKSFDGFCPLGPAIVTINEVADPNELPIFLKLNGKLAQSSNTADMIFPVRQIIASLSRTMTVRAGSVILSGTPEGVGDARTPPVYLKPGDTTEATVEGVGTLTTRFA